MRSVRLSSGLRQVQRLRPVPQTFSRCRCSSSLCMIPRSPSAFLSTGSARFLSQEAQEDAEEKQEKPPRKDDPYVDVLEAALEHVPEKGFTLEAIEAGAADLEYPKVVQGMFPNGAADLVLYFYDQCNAKLFEKLKSGEFDAPTTVEFLESALWYRLSLIIPVIEHWPEAMARLSAPAVIPEALQRVKQLMDEITIHSGHRSLSLGWYGRRLTTTAVYKSTELFMLSDESVDKSNSREFLRRRLDGLRSVEDCQKLVTTDAPNVIAGVATIVQGVLGVASESVWGPKGVSSASVSEDRGSKKTSSSKSTGADPSSKSNGADPVATPP